jgi:hypothetical protein
MLSRPLDADELAASDGWIATSRPALCPGRRQGTGTLPFVAPPRFDAIEREAACRGASTSSLWRVGAGHSKPSAVVASSIAGRDMHEVAAKYGIAVPHPILDWRTPLRQLVAFNSLHRNRATCERVHIPGARTRGLIGLLEAEPIRLVPANYLQRISTWQSRRIFSG